MAHLVGSVQPGMLADLVLWKPVRNNDATRTRTPAVASRAATECTSDAAMGTTTQKRTPLSN